MLGAGTERAVQSSNLVSVLQRGAILAGSTGSEGKSDIRDVLTSRLSQYYSALGQDQVSDVNGALENVQLRTAQEALVVIEQVQSIVSPKRPDANRVPTPGQTSENDAPEELLGTRDLAQLCTLLSLVFKWAVEPLLSRVSASIPNTTPGGRRRTEVNIIDLTSVPEDYQLLRSILFRVTRLLLLSGVRGSLNATHITSAIVDRHLGDLLKPCLVLGWLPKSLSSESVLPLDDLRPVAMRLINTLPVSRSVTALSGILSGQVSLVYVQKICSHLMSRQILRHNGVRGLFIALFAEEDVSGDDALLEKLENVAKLLRSLPKGMEENQYYGNIVQQLLSILSAEGDISSSHRRAAAFSLSRMVFPSDEKDRTGALVSRILSPALQRPFLEITQGLLFDNGSSSSSADIPCLAPNQAIQALQTLLTNTDPSPELISSLLTPIVPPLYALLWTFDSVKTSEPLLKTIVRGFMRTWGRLVDGPEGIATLWLVVNGEGGEWQVDVAGAIARIEQTNAISQLGMFTPEDLRRAEEAGEFDVDANILHLRPDPKHFVAFLKSLDRSDVVSDLFVRLLESYRESKAAHEADPMRTLLFLQLIVQIQNQLSSGDSALGILKRPDHVLSFIKHALQTAAQRSSKVDETFASRRQTGLKLEDLHIVDVDEDDSNGEILEADSDDEDEPSIQREGSDEEITSTALNLLLAVMEANPSLNTQTVPILGDIFSLLESLAKESSEAIKPLAREARMVLTARLASSSISQAPTGSTMEAGESPQGTYQKALKLLQDPILPVRAHGLLLLRQLVSARLSNDNTLREPALDRALVPGILGIFLQSLQDDDSYIFLTAVQGLAAMVEGFGKDVLKGLVEMYAKGLDGVGSMALTRLDVDTRTRVGEALGQVIKRCGDALPGYADLLVPPLFGVARASHLPTALRTSALSLLAQFANTSAVATLPYAVDLTAAMLDLLQVESVPVVHKPRDRTTQVSDATSEGGLLEESSESKVDPERSKRRQDAVNYQPTTKDSKIPTLRRSALYFITLLARAFASQLEMSSGSVYALPGDLMRRAKTIVGYVTATDEDLVVRVMARETLEGLDNLAEAMLRL
ncbi:uncharacterized protein PHACADRAFT_114971 [Phanerochaete carnosa HHB-10118-sp]|uniref:RNA polymerase II assembly factor Rtp1 C-terminal domain-containing protein n=1 Tax=Phanerochaete carnosa (strain HHB-10118-sp) TaxID=650164 RepID=K5WK46_PHACS|nr:uncharacterized protein PHACADRAFT_114971 [Phanerochaete carnosa HHB-10118-sp]EKM59775.1 hypothetical protein PHACADRAFT_114971 [Phanerochaete carnosa HHB-10118-sp]